MKKSLLSIFNFLASGLLMAQSPFPVLNENFYDQTAHPTDPTAIVIPASTLKYDVLFEGGVDYVHNANGDSALAKEWHDFTGFIPNNGRSDLGYLIINHERVQRDTVNGDGGGMTVFEVKYDSSSSSWTVIPDTATGKMYRNVDFTPVGGTGANCGGIQTSWGKVFTAEEWNAFFSNAVISAQGIRDTADWTVTTFNGAVVNQAIPKHMNYQYMVEIDVKNAVALRKAYNMGRYAHEGGWIASDRRTAYLSDDKSSGSVLFRFVANSPEDFTSGQLSFYKQSDDGTTGTWQNMPMTLNDMMNARSVALQNGATVFMRLEWVEGVAGDSLVYITETGRGSTVSVAGAINAGGKLANHLIELDAADGSIDTTFNDIYGRVLRLNTQSGKIDVAIEGGGRLNGNYDATGNHMSSPDGLASTVINGRTYLAINEDMNPSGKPSNPGHFSGKLNEIYLLDVTGDVSGKVYTAEDLSRFAVGPAGCETTGGRFTPDGSTYFVNIQHPSSTNTPPFNHSVTVAITGYQPIITQLRKPQFNEDKPFDLYPNPATREVYLNKKMDVAIYDMKGKRLKVQRQTTILDINDLTPGTYIVRNDKGFSRKLIIQ